MKCKFLSFFFALTAVLILWKAEFTIKAAEPEGISFTVTYDQSAARKMAEMLNDYRKDNGLDALIYDCNLEKVAMQRAAEIAVKYNWEGDTHTRPDGLSWKRTLADYGFNISPRGILYGENILFGTQDSMELDSAFNKLCSHEGNRTQMLGYYALVGIGHVKIEEKTDFWVQVFANRGEAGEYTAPFDGEMVVTVMIDPSYVSDIQVEYKSGEQTVVAGSSKSVPVYIPKIKVSGSEMENLLELSPLNFESDDGYVRAANGVMTGLREGSGNISAHLLGNTYSYGVNVTVGSGVTTTSVPTSVVTATPIPTQVVTPTPTQVVTPTPTQAVTPTPTQAATPTPTQAVTPTPTQAATPTPTQNVTPTSTPSEKLKVGDIFSEGKLKYKVTGKKSVEVIGLSSKSVTSISIPATVKKSGISYKVVKIADSAFKGKVKLKTVKIGKNVKTIGSSAFYGCTKLKTIKISGKSLKTIGNKAFGKINSKASISVPSASYKAYKKLLESSGYTGSIKKS